MKLYTTKGNQHSPASRSAAHPSGDANAAMNLAFGTAKQYGERAGIGKKPTHDSVRRKRKTRIERKNNERMFVISEKEQDDNEIERRMDE